MDFYDAVALRRSVRGYKSDPLPDEALSRIKKAVLAAPSACNRQPLRFIFITSPEVRKAVCGCYSRPWLAEAPMIVAACGDAGAAWHRFDGSSAVNIDLGIAMEHLVLAAASEGIGSCWICAFDVEAMSAALGVKPPWQVLAITPLGYASAEAAAPGRKTPEEFFAEVR